MIGIGKKNYYESQKQVPWIQQGRPSIIMVLRFPYHGVTEIHFSKTEVKANLKVYCSMLDAVIEPVNDTLSEPCNWCFQ